MDLKNWMVLEIGGKIIILDWEEETNFYQKVWKIEGSRNRIAAFYTEGII